MKLRKLFLNYCRSIDCVSVSVTQMLSRVVPVRRTTTLVTGMILRTVLLATWLSGALSLAAAAQTVTMGETAVLTATDNGNGNLLLAQGATLAQAATIESLSFYVTAASGNLILGIYDATGPNGGPGTLKASTNSFTPAAGWNTAKVVTPLSLSAGTYWLAYLPSSNSLGFVKTNATGNCTYYADRFGSLPSKFSTSPARCTPTTWSFYATLAASSSTSAGGGSSGSGSGGSGSSGSGSSGSGSSGSGSHGPGSRGHGSHGSGSSGSGSSGSGSSGSGSSGSGSSGSGSSGSGSSGSGSSGSGSSGSGSSGSGSSGSGSSGSGSSGSGSSGSGSSGSGSSGSGSSGSGSSSSSGSDPTSGVLPSYNDAYANWKNAGLLSVGGIPNRTTVCATVNPSGVTPPASNDDANNISNAIASCPSGEVVMLAAGTFKISMSEYITVGNSVTLRGSGTCNNSGSPYCQTVIEVYDGTLAWTGGNCGTSTSAEEACVSNPAIQVQPSAAVNLYDFGWSSCGIGNVASTSCGAVALTADASQGQTTI